VADAWIDVAELKQRLSSFFDSNHREFSRFGSTVNQTFEAFVLAQVVSWYRQQPGWTVEPRNPRNDETNEEVFRLKFSTRGRPGNYSYFECRGPDDVALHVRHQLRVATKWHRQQQHPAANICLDVAVIKAIELARLSTRDFVANDALVTFGEAKHMSAFAELIAAFIGLVHELQPARLRRVRKAKLPPPRSITHPAPFLFVSGKLWATADGLVQTIQRRSFDIDVYWSTSQLSSAIGLPTGGGPTSKSKQTAQAGP